MAWAIMCITYIYFKRAVDQNGLETVKESQSLLQPWLAYWAIFWCMMMSMTHYRVILTEVLFEGFKVLLGWHRLFQDKVQWAFELSTYSAIIIFLLLFGVSRWVLGETAFQRRELNAADIADGMAPMDEPRPEVGPRWRRAINAILNFI